MAHTHSEDSYGFTTFIGNASGERIVAEAKDNVDFIVTHAVDSVTGLATVAVFVRKLVFEYVEDILHFELGPYPLAKYVDDILENANDNHKWVAQEWVGLSTKNGKKAANTLKNQIKRIKNALNGRTIKVTVTSF